MAIDPERLTLLYELNRGLATSLDLDELQRSATRRVRELFAADGCALLLLDSTGREFHFPIASQRESRGAMTGDLRDVRFPATEGIAGWVLLRDTGTIVLDAQNDGRFFPGVDVETGITTRTMLCAPLRTVKGNIGVIQVINPGGPPPTEDDLQFLEAIADDLASAHERAKHIERLRSEAVDLRKACTITGYLMLGAGIVLGLSWVATAMAMAVPLSEALWRPRFVGASSAIVMGVGLIALAHGWRPPRSTSS